jgi:hypothetical protein
MEYVVPLYLLRSSGLKDWSLVQRRVKKQLKIDNLLDVGLCISSSVVVNCVPGMLTSQPSTELGGRLSAAMLLPIRILKSPLGSLSTRLSDMSSGNSLKKTFLILNLKKNTLYPCKESNFWAKLKKWWHVLIKASAGLSKKSRNEEYRMNFLILCHENVHTIKEGFISRRTDFLGSLDMVQNTVKSFNQHFDRYNVNI